MCDKVYIVLILEHPADFCFLNNSDLDYGKTFLSQNFLCSVVQLQRNKTLLAREKLSPKIMHINRYSALISFERAKTC